MRALGTGAATAWMRIASVVGPLIVGALIGGAGIRSVFLFFAVAAMTGLVVVHRFTIETRGMRLEDIAREGPTP
jgi:putative MFS transporter